MVTLVKYPKVSYTNSMSEQGTKQTVRADELDWEELALLTTKGAYVLRLSHDAGQWLLVKVGWDGEGSQVEQVLSHAGVQQLLATEDVQVFARVFEVTL